jgi:hypothetical protein
VISTDFVPEMVAAARRESERLGLANVEHREMDAVLQAMPEADREAVRSLVELATGDFRANGGLELPGVALNASAE